MAYTLDNSPAAMNAPRTLQTSATTWQQLANPAPPVRRVKIRMGGGEETLILPVFSPRLGDDLSNTDIFGVTGSSGIPISDLASQETFSTDQLLSGNPFETGGVTGAESNLTPLAQQSIDQGVAQASGAYSPYSLPITASGGLNVPGSVAQNAALAQAVPGNSAYQALIAAGMTAAQIANLTGQPPTAIVPTATVQAGIVPGISNTALLIAAVIGVIILSGKKR